MAFGHSGNHRGVGDAPHLSTATPAEDKRTILLNEIAWGAVLAGVVVALVTQLLLNMLGLGIGIATLDPGTGDNPTASSLSIGAGIWWTLSGILASLVGGYAAGRLSGKPKEATAAWHGLTALGLHHAGHLLPAELDRRGRAGRGLQHGQRRHRRPRPDGCDHRRCRGTGDLADDRPDGGDRGFAAQRQWRQRSGCLARCCGDCHARGTHRRRSPGARGARACRCGHRPGAGHPDRGGAHPGRGVRAAIPADGRSGAAAGNRGRRHGRPGGFARGAVRLCRPSAGRGGGLARRARGCRLPDPDQSHAARPTPGERQRRTRRRQRYRSGGCPSERCLCPVPPLEHITHARLGRPS